MSAHKLELGVAIATGLLANWLTALARFVWISFTEGLNAAVDRRQKRYLRMLFASARDQHIYLSYLAIMFVGLIQANVLLIFVFSRDLGFASVFVAIYYFQTLFAIQELYKDVVRVRSRWQKRGRVK
jgi:uncharacterized membrane protein YoaK (UPF0700 family)